MRRTLCVKSIRYWLNKGVSGSLVLVNLVTKSRYYSPVKHSTCSLACRLYSVLVISSALIEVHSAGKNLDTDCRPLSVKIEFGLPYGMTQCSCTTNGNSGAVTIGNKTASVRLLCRSVIAMTSHISCVVLVRVQRMSIAINSSGLLGRNS